MDSLKTLPTDQYPVDASERKIMDSVFVPPPSTFYKFTSELKEPLLAGILFLIMNLPQVDSLISSTVPYAKSSNTSLLFFKTFVFVVLLFLIQNCNIIMKST
jgi:hypothetical protein